MAEGARTGRRDPHPAGDEVVLAAADCQDLERASGLEWLEVNGRGGYASGTASGLPTRCTQGLLLVAAHAPHDRVMLVNHLSEWVETPEGLVALSTLGAAEAAEDGYRRCAEFRIRPWPEWRYDLGAVAIVRSIVCPRGRDAVIVRWQMLGDGPGLRLLLKPMLTGRPDHAVVGADAPLQTTFSREDAGVSWRPRSELPAIHARGEFEYRHDPGWMRGIAYPIDRERGEPSREDWWSPGTLSVRMTPDRAAVLTFTVEPNASEDGAACFEAELDRRRANRRALRLTGDRLYDQLQSTAETFTVEVGDRAAVLAGFPWFDVWTRDTFTAFAGLFLATGRLQLAGRVLGTFAPLVDGGLLPNNLPDARTPPTWTSVDASLWFIVAVGRYADVASDRAVLAATWPAVRAILRGYASGTSHVSIGVDEDGLVRASDDRAPLTWMDAQCDGTVMTPRRGKPVEVQALWIQALGVGRALGHRLGHPSDAAEFERARARAIAAFQRRFWYEAGGYLFDVIDGPDGDDPSFRPNQLFALSFDAELVSPPRGRRVLELARRKLLTPLGLRTLAPDDPRYQRRYAGARPARDAAYHQGTVWPFLLAPFIEAWLRFRGPSEQARAEARSFCDGIEKHLTTSACLGHLSEIFDGDAPHNPRGCFAQAWSLGEMLLTLKKLVGGQVRNRRPESSDRSSSAPTFNATAGGVASVGSEPNLGVIRVRQRE
jgi:predicted glycogen debranching enzyme